MPDLIVNFVGELGSCFVPVSLLMAGYTIAEYPLGDVFIRPKSYAFSALRLLVFPLLAIGLCKLMGCSAYWATLAVFAFACPSGMNVVVFPSAYGQDCRTGASIVLLSSLGAIVTIPLLYALVQLLFP